MKLATVFNNSRDGKLLTVSKDGSRYLSPKNFTTMLQALENWDGCVEECTLLNERLTNGEGKPSTDLHFLAPLPRTWQWLDGSAFTSHGQLMQKAFNHKPLENTKPLMYQGMSDHFFGPTEDVPFMREEDGIDFEGEIAVIVDEVPMGVTAREALAHIKLIVLINDWSLRSLALAEMKTGFGWIQAKPACSMAHFAVTPDEAGEYWKNGRLSLNLEVNLNNSWFGNPTCDAMEVGFHELIAHAAATRKLSAGTIIGSGTVSNDNYREVGSTCISEKRGIEIVDQSEAKTEFMRFGDRIAMSVKHPDGTALFGCIDQQVISLK